MKSNFMLTLKILSIAMYRGKRSRPISLASNTVVVSRTPAVTLLAKSKTPTKGLVTAPTRPRPIPPAKPMTPPSSAPSIGRF